MPPRAIPSCCAMGLARNLQHLDCPTSEEYPMSLTMILLIVLILILIGSVPAWPYSRGWGYGPSGIVGAIVLVLVILWLMGRL